MDKGAFIIHLLPTWKHILTYRTRGRLLRAAKQVVSFGQPVDSLANGIQKRESSPFAAETLGRETQVTREVSHSARLQFYLFPSIFQNSVGGRCNFGHAESLFRRNMRKPEHRFDYR